MNVSNFNTSLVTDMGAMFSRCSSLGDLNVSNFNTSSVTNMGNMFEGCSSLGGLNLSNFDTSSVTNMGSMFARCSGLGGLNLSNFDTSSVTNMGNMFESCSSLGDLNLRKFNTSSVVNMSAMFAKCSSLTSIDIDVNNFNTGEVKQMNGMFTGCVSLKNLDVSEFDTSKVENMYDMFADCQSLRELNVSKFNTEKVTNMGGMFKNCFILEKLDVSKFITNEVTNMSDMFAGCKTLDSLDVSKFDTSKVKQTIFMFADCNNLTYLDLSNFDMSQVSQMDGMFIVEDELPLLVKTNDHSLLNYDYSVDGRYPGGPKFEANGGSFSPDLKEETKYYFEQCAVRADSPKFALATFNEFRNNLKPTKEGNVFSGWKVTSGSEPVNDEQLLFPVTYMAQWRTGGTGGVNIPSQDQDNIVTPSASSYGIAYIPKQFAIDATPLGKEVEQVISFKKVESFHIGVRDMRNTVSSWKLEARLQWDKVLPGAEIVLDNSSGTIQKNINDGVNPFDPAKDFIDCPSSEATGEANAVITSNSSVPIMRGEKIAHNAVYDYNLGNISLRIPNPKNVEASSYVGKVVWNLSDTL